MNIKFHSKILFLTKIIKCWISITKYLVYQYGILYCSRSSGSDVCWRNQKNVNNNKIIFSADNNVLIKLLRQKKRYGAKKFITKFSSKLWTLSGLNKRLPNTGHFTFWDKFTKAALNIVCVDRFNLNLTFWLPIDSALLRWNFARMRCCLIKLCKCTQWFTYVTSYW